MIFVLLIASISSRSARTSASSVSQYHSSSAFRSAVADATASATPMRIRTAWNSSSSSWHRAESSLVTATPLSGTARQTNLIGLRFGIPKHLVEDVRFDRLPVDRDLARERRNEHPSDLDREQTGITEQLLSRCSREEAQMRSVEQTPVAVLESTLEEREANVDVRDIRERGDDVPVWLDQLREGPHRRQRITKVLEDVAQQHDVEDLVFEFGHVVVDVEVGDQHLVSVLLGRARRARVDLDARHLAAA